MVGSWSISCSFSSSFCLVKVRVVGWCSLFLSGGICGWVVAYLSLWWCRWLGCGFHLLFFLFISLSLSLSLVKVRAVGWWSLLLWGVWVVRRWSIFISGGVGGWVVVRRGM